MASTQNALICGLLALGLWSCIGFSISSRILPTALALPVAPIVGWAVHSVVVLPLMFGTGMARAVVIVVTALSLIAAIIVIYQRPSRSGDDADDHIRLPWWAIAGAAILAGLVMAAIIPKIAADGITLAGPIFDHAKVAMIDDMARLGVPAGNPFFGETGSPERLSYYYLWHFAAAELAVLTGLGGWNADAGMTWFTAFSSLTLMMGFAIWISARASAAAWVLIVAATASIRPVINHIAGSNLPNDVIGWPSGFAAWIFQIAWAPQHVASACCAVIACFLLMRMARQASVLLVIVFALMAAAAFESSTWVGGVTFPLAAAAIAASVMIADAPGRCRFALRVAAAAVLALALISPFVYDQLRVSLARADGAPIAIVPFEVIDHRYLTPATAAILDVVAYWCIFLVVTFAAFYPVGAVMIARVRNDRALAQDRRDAALMLGLLALVSLAVGNVLASRIGANNDLAWRGVLPAILVLVAFTAAGLARYGPDMRRLRAAAVLLIALGLPEGARIIHDNVVAPPTPSSKLFAGSADMWRAVRAHSAADDRVANNPYYLSDMTGWPINISWALLANRRSCYGGNDLAMPFTALTKQRRAEVDAQFDRIFAGRAGGDDLRQLATRYDCRLVVLTPQDGAWSSDIFAASAFYRLVDDTPQWRLYRAMPAD